MGIRLWFRHLSGGDVVIETHNRGQRYAKQLFTALFDSPAAAHVIRRELQAPHGCGTLNEQLIFQSIHVESRLAVLFGSPSTG